MNYPKEALDQRLHDRVYVSFVVETTGELSNFKIIRGKHDILNQEALRVIKSMPLWEPGQVGNKAVRTKYTLPIVFALD